MNDFSEPALWGWLWDFGAVTFRRNGDRHGEWYECTLGSKTVRSATLAGVIEGAWKVVQKKRQQEGRHESTE
jgi:hypothetical protein